MSNEARQLMRDVLFWLGFKKDDYEFNDAGGVHVKNWMNLERALAIYRDRFKLQVKVLKSLKRALLKKLFSRF